MRVRSSLHNHNNTSFSNPFNTKRFLDYERNEIKKAKQDKIKLHAHDLHSNQSSAAQFKAKPLSTKQHISSSSHPTINTQTSSLNLSVTSSKQCSRLSPNITDINHIMQSKGCDDIWRETVKAKQTKTKSHQLIVLQMEREAILRYKEAKSERKRRNSITSMMNQVLVCCEAEKERKCMKGRDKMVKQYTLKQFSEERFKINVEQLNLKRDKKKNNVIVGVQIMSKKKTNTIYCNERGEIFMDKKHVKRGCKIKDKSEIMISVEYEDDRTISVDFWYVLHGKMVQIERKPILIENVGGFEHEVKVTVFVAQNENAKCGEYLMRKLQLPQNA